MRLGARRNKVDPADHRASLRVRPPASAPVDVQIMGTHSIDFMKARDISELGIGVSVSHGFDACDVNSEIELVITLPGCRPFSAHGLLRHLTVDAEDTHFGVVFTKIRKHSRSQIRAYVQEHASAAPGD